MRADAQTTLHAVSIRLADFHLATSYRLSCLGLVGLVA